MPWPEPWSLTLAEPDTRLAPNQPNHRDPGLFYNLEFDTKTVYNKAALDNAPVAQWIER